MWLDRLRGKPRRSGRGLPRIDQYGRYWGESLVFSSAALGNLCTKPNQTAQESKIDQISGFSADFFLKRSPYSGETLFQDAPIP